MTNVQSLRAVLPFPRYCPHFRGRVLPILVSFFIYIPIYDRRVGWIYLYFIFEKLKQSSKGFRLLNVP